MAQTTVQDNNKLVRTKPAPVLRERPMAELKAATRNKIPTSQFGLPGQRKYPMPDKSHAANAKGRAKQMLKRGSISKAAYDQVIAKANRKLGKRGSAEDENAEADQSS
jgi:hypothetical protein